MSINNSPSTKYYVYTLARPDGSVFYVGKGQGQRIEMHEKEARQHPNHTCNNARKCQTICEIWAAGGQVQRAIVFESDDEQAAFDRERELIAQYGRENLCNVREGGRVINVLPMADQEKQLKFRVSTALHEAISVQAARDTRTLQGEIIVLLKEALSARGVTIEDDGQAPKLGVAVTSPVMAV